MISRVHISVCIVLGEFMSKVKMRIVEGVVYLSGQLDSHSDYEKVIILVESTKGIKDVNAEELQVQGQEQSLTDCYLTAKVKGALIREDIFGKDICSWPLIIHSENGRVLLSGSVNSIKQKESILRVVKEVHGVAQIEDELQLISCPKDG
ncbi:osmotically inducible protein Y [Legionella jordanis]|uniref:Osmotically inducible protein Y n=2 Tax=Legionella jordanis TaxID=456 RepID=A0A0W0VCD6_9GAMM|nr:osmotically inducible protein Y [Legionella jordanis]VEH13518.1 osmotically inducible protein Y [Legionella jordanis]